MITLLLALGPHWAACGDEKRPVSIEQRITYRVDSAEYADFVPADTLNLVGSTIEVLDSILLSESPGGPASERWVEKAERTHIVRFAGAEAAERRSRSRLTKQRIRVGPSGGRLVEDNDKSDKLLRVLEGLRQNLFPSILPGKGALDDATFMDLMWPGGALYWTDIDELKKPIEERSGLNLALTYLNPSQLRLGSNCEWSATRVEGQGADESLALQYRGDASVDVATLLDIRLPEGEYSHVIRISFEGSGAIDRHREEPVRYEGTSHWIATEAITLSYGGRVFSAKVVWSIDRTVMVRTP